MASKFPDESALQVSQNLADGPEEHKRKNTREAVKDIRQNAGTICEELMKMMQTLTLDMTELENEYDTEHTDRLPSKRMSEDKDDCSKNTESSHEQLSKEVTNLEKLLLFFRTNVHEADDDIIVKMEKEFIIQKERLSKTDTTDIDDIHQSYEGNADDATLPLVKLEEQSCFGHCDDPCTIMRIFPITSNEAWVLRLDSSQIEQIDTNVTLIKEMEIDCDDFIQIKDDLVFISTDDKIIRRVAPSGSMSDICTTTSFHPHGISTALDGGMLICLCDSDYEHVSQNSTGEVRHLDAAGVTLRTYRHTDFQNKLFTCPFRAAQNINSDICVLEYAGEECSSRLVVVSFTSELKFIYTGQPTLKEKFSPTDVCCDQRGRILVTDFFNGGVHILRKDGNFLQHVLSPVWASQSLALFGDILWIAGDEGYISVYKYSEEEELSTK
ncbi:hypothetical protein FSP39_016512 [Pinctada imbricata]|uniref:Uncharacterized protein n=1 Tax=Pinctada imbricata TaxID=66713 RepID=A0AA89BV07_PINIB|nr:hypothetical protein FSP39_016512 [Pinctada imbricata]